ncbi:Mov34/MPN/PAD-1 family protein [Aeromonas salmonicida]|uniref:Mov34/MPN/PAD-1 family protein n=1 Tax=Aeromonas salmonicida TaxID=645 RepID=UPI001788A70E|nr:Mov34/MPN/PAD-1 family protein [Aeromonas salmonicida]QOI95897.1 Mov34/MPN/PAD-1 family protein [Aeromonas salmonicida subsp. masoucida]
MLYQSDELEGLNVTFTATAVQIMGCYQQKPRMNEAGGMLFGSFDGPNVIVRCVSTPSPKDIRTRTRFKPNLNEANKTILKMRNLGLHYLGDWHTHSERRPTPSRDDMQSIQRAYNQDVHNLRFMILFILSNQDPKLSYCSLSDGRREYLLDVN